MTAHFEDRAAIVTGGACGIGAATVRRLAAAGARLLICDLDTEAGEALAAETRTASSRCWLSARGHRKSGRPASGWRARTSAKPSSRQRANRCGSVTAAGSTLAAMQHVSPWVTSVIIEAQPGSGPKP